ncbi:MAG: AAA family ATPase [Deltaproteobacteria bacterium]|nr:AAA family ATPase [Deltaproteobacteria bacterium]MBW1967260.1 AAA family ATPase [Deltaproteobacteria bacterium]MBW2098010.1 AAA family ATPase [Deltaproteobacteria bacterium]
MKIAVSGKGGAGKTTIAAFLIQALADRDRQVLAIDADPSPHLARALDFPQAEEIRPIAEMRDLIQERSERDGPFYRLNPKVSDLPERFMRQKGNIKLMVLGAIQQGGAGCACADNAVLRTLLNILLLSPNEDIVIDMEAGVEHLGRGTIASVDHLLIVIQPYRGSLETASKILALGKDLKINHLGIVANQVHGLEDLNYIQDYSGVKPIGVFPDSDEVREAERTGAPIYNADSAFGKSARDLLNILERMK